MSIDYDELYVRVKERKGVPNPAGYVAKRLDIKVPNLGAAKSGRRKLPERCGPAMETLLREVGLLNGTESPVAAVAEAAEGIVSEAGDAETTVVSGNEGVVVVPSQESETPAPPEPGELLELVAPEQDTVTETTEQQDAASEAVESPRPVLSAQEAVDAAEAELLALVGDDEGVDTPDDVVNMDDLVADANAWIEAQVETPSIGDMTNQFMLLVEAGANELVRGHIIARVREKWPDTYTDKRTLESAWSREVKDYRDWVSANQGSDDNASDEHPIAFPDAEPWPEPVDGLELASEMEALFHEHMVLPIGGEVPCVLFPFHTWAFEFADYTPHLRFKSPLYRSGKTNSATLVVRMCRRPDKSSGHTEATFFRSIDTHHPTMLIDEAEKFLRKNPAVIGMLNMSYERGNRVPRMVSNGDDWTVQYFDVFTPTILTGNRDLADDVEDRSIILNMRRGTRDELKRVKKFRLRGLTETLDTVQRKLARWAQDHGEELQRVIVSYPEVLDSRKEDIWEPLFQVARVLGGDWYTRCLSAAEALSGTDHDPADDGYLLLLDIRRVMLAECDNDAAQELPDKFTSKWLCAALGKLETSLWPTYSFNKVITGRDMAKLLKPFGIEPVVLKVDRHTKHSKERGVTIGKRGGHPAVTARGYRKSTMLDIWARYLPPYDPAEDHAVE